MNRDNAHKVLQPEQETPASWLAMAIRPPETQAPLSEQQAFFLESLAFPSMIV